MLISGTNSNKRVVGTMDGWFVRRLRERGALTALYPIDRFERANDTPPTTKIHLFNTPIFDDFISLLLRCGIILTVVYFFCISASLLLSLFFSK